MLAFSTEPWIIEYRLKKTRCFLPRLRSRIFPNFPDFLCSGSSSSNASHFDGGLEEDAEKDVIKAAMKAGAKKARKAEAEYERDVSDSFRLLNERMNEIGCTDRPI